MMRCFKKIIRRITTGRSYNDETDVAIRRSLLNEGSDLGPGECYHDLQRVILKNEKSDVTRYEIIQSAEFRSDLKRMIRRGMDLTELEDAVTILASGGMLPKRYRDHRLRGNYRGARECYIRPDWILIYSRDDERLILREIRTGSHSDLFRGDADDTVT